jgi:hypothetical protein
MWTLVEAQKRSTDLLEKGIIMTIIKESPILRRLKFKGVQGNSYKYNRELTMPTVGWYGVGDTWNESSGTVAQCTAALYILGGDIDVDNFEADTLSNINDLQAEAIESKSKAMAHGFEGDFIYGNNTTNPKQPDGLHVLVDSNLQVHAGSGSTGGVLAMAKLDELIDLVKPGRPDALIMPRRLRTRIGEYYRDGSAASQFTMERGEDGFPLERYGGIPLLVNDFQLMTETISSGAFEAATGGATGSIFAVRFAEDGLHGIQSGGIKKYPLGELETKDAKRWRVKWYLGWALKNIYSLARLDGVTDAVVTD